LGETYWMKTFSMIVKKVFFLALGVLLLLVGVNALIQSHQEIQAKKHWDSVSAKIISTSSRSEHHRNGSNTHCDSIKISCDYNHLVYHTHLNQTFPCQESVSGVDYINDLKTRFPDGSAISIIVNPTNPAENSDLSFANTEPIFLSNFFCYATIFLGLVFIVALWAKAPPKVEKKSDLY
jgi:hypothetical protein